MVCGKYELKLVPFNIMSNTMRSAGTEAVAVATTSIRDGRTSRIDIIGPDPPLNCEVDAEQRAHQQETLRLSLQQNNQNIGQSGEQTRYVISCYEAT